MALSDNLKNAGDEIERLNDLGTEFSAVYKDIGEALKGLARDSKDFGSGIGDAEKLSRDLAKSAQELAGFTKEDLKDRKKVADFTKKADALNSKRAKLQSQIRTFQAQTVNATKAEQSILEKVNRNLQNSSNYTQEITDGFEEILDTSKNIEKTNPFKGLGDLVSEIPVLNKFFPEFEKASSSFRDNMAEGNGFLKSSGKAAGELAGFFSKLTVGLAVKGLQDFDERSTSLSRNLNTSREQADGLVKSANAAARSIKGVTGKDITTAQQSFAQSLGTTATLSNEVAANFATLQNRLGLSAEQASDLTKFSEALGQNSKTQTEELIAQTQILNAQTDSSIQYQEIIKDIAGTNKAVLLSTKGNSQELAKAAFEAKKFGLNLNQVDGIAGSLLDFESSIAAELEAELLTGKQLNLEKARQAALDGDLATLASEIASEAGSLEEFQDMNRIQQEAIAKAVGMTREELANSLVEQQALTKLGAKDTNDLREKTRERLKEINLIKDAAAREEARGKLIAELGSDELVRQQENRNLQELQAEASQKIIEAFDKLSPILESVRNLFDKIANNAGVIAGTLGAIAGISLIGKFSRLLKVFKNLGKAAKNFKSFLGLGKTTTKSVSKTAASSLTKSSGGVIMKSTGKAVYGAAGEAALKAGSGTLAKQAGKIGLKSAGRALVKKIPIIGALAGVGFAISRAAKGDYAGAALELASGAASTIPGIGTAASVAIDAGLAARDISQSKSRSAPQTMKVDDFTIKSNPKDTLVMAGGTRFGEETNALLKELISAVKQGGDVYMDSTKVGTAMSVGTYKVQ